jgi:hypothetical protein
MTYEVDGIQDIALSLMNHKLQLYEIKIIDKFYNHKHAAKKNEQG